MDNNSFDNNSFDNNNNENIQNGESSYEIYSKSYTPSENGYTEQKQSYQGGEYHYSYVTPERSKNKTGRKILAVFGVAVCALVLCVGTIFCTAKIVSDYYEGVIADTPHADDGLPEVTDGGENKVEVTEPQDADISEENDGDWFFGFNEKTDITFSDSETQAVSDVSIGDSGLSKADVAELVSASVVEITTSETLRNGLVYSSGAGSGVIVTENGIIITNNHVVEGATEISVRLSNGNVYDAALVATDAETDLAVIKIEPKEALTIAVCGNSKSLRVGDEVLAIGNPLGLLGGTVTNGIVSALEREVTIEGETMVLLQHNAAVSPGNSGGALFNMKGELIGIVNAKYSSNGAEGLGFAIPMNTVSEVYNDLVNYGYVKGRADHGLSIVQQYAFRPGYYGYLLYIVESKYTSELVYGDRLIAINGVTPASADEAYALLDGYEIGDTVDVTVYRSGKEITVKVPISEYHP